MNKIHSPSDISIEGYNDVIWLIQDRLINLYIHDQLKVQGEETIQKFKLFLK
jgi:hypothetical protein